MRHPDEVAAIPIAITGMACRLPGADNLDEFWKMLVEGRSSVRELGPDRLDQELYFDPNVGVRGKTYSKLASICSSRQFDQQACAIPDQLVRSADNVHLLMCETAANAPAQRRPGSVQRQRQEHRSLHWSRPGKRPGLRADLWHLRRRGSPVSSRSRGFSGTRRTDSARNLPGSRS